MSRVVVLDAGPLGLATNPKGDPESVACAAWAQSLAAAGTRVVIPEIADFEVRRELLRASKRRGIARLDGFATLFEYLPLTTPAMRHAARLWAQARQHGYPTAGDAALDVDVILAGQALALNVSDVVIATTNVGHLSRFVAADLWQNISPT
ncbi:MAG TPA: PIN domain-containing protein [Planctomycetaceae bacterium]|nr:PIN domain-containing protein [Planctomycetaceae bacterium]